MKDGNDWKYIVNLVLNWFCDSLHRLKGGGGSIGFSFDPLFSLMLIYQRIGYY